jgi:hypothetical protein
LIEEIEHNAEKVLGVAQDLTDSDMEYGRDAVAWMEDYIEGQRIRDDEELKQSLCSMLGSFFGVCLICEYGGEWIEADEGFGIRFNDKLTAYPFNKVEKQFASGREAGEGTLSMFDSTGAILAKYRGA